MNPHMIDTPEALRQRATGQAGGVAATHLPAGTERPPSGLLAARLAHALATMVNDDTSEPSTPKRARLAERMAVMQEAIQALTGVAP